MKYSIGNVIVFPVLIVSSTITIILLTMLSIEHFKQLESLYLSRFSLLNENFIQSFRQDLLLGQLGEVSRNCSNFAKNPLVIGVSVSDSEGRTVCGSGNVAESRTLRTWRIAEKILFDRLGSKSAGDVEVIYDLQPLFVELRALVLKGVWLILIGVAINISIYFVIRKMVVRPIVYIRRAVGEETLPRAVSHLEGQTFRVLELEQLRRTLIESLGALLRAEIDKTTNARESATVSIAKQVAHDIRAPLSALNIVSQVLRRENFDEIKLLSKSIQRINEIADDLLSNSRSSNSSALQNIAVLELVSRISDLVGEFKLRYQGVLNIQRSLSGNMADLEVLVNLQQFQRLFSNLLQNSYEARKPGQQVNIFVMIQVEQDLEMEIRDDGIGIPSSIASRLGRSEVTFGKKEGNGLGVLSAKNAIESWGGSFAVYSAEGEGTSVKISMPIIGIN